MPGAAAWPSLVRYLPPVRQQGAAGGGNHGSTHARRCEPRCTVLPLRRTRWYPGMPPARAPYLALISRAPGACALIICVRTSPGVSPCPMCMGSVCRRRVLSGLARSPPCRGGWGGEPMGGALPLGFRGACWVFTRRLFRTNLECFVRGYLPSRASLACCDGRGSGVSISDHTESQRMLQTPFRP